MGFRRKLTVGTLAAVAVLAPVLTAVPASATTWDHAMHTNDGNPGGRVRFKQYGDVVELCDIEADGWSVELYVYDMWPGSQVDHIKVGGKGNCVTHSAANGHNLAEKHEIEFDIGLSNSTHKMSYSDISVWNNW